MKSKIKHEGARGRSHVSRKDLTFNLITETIG